MIAQLPTVLFINGVANDLLVGYRPGKLPNVFGSINTFNYINSPLINKQVIILNPQEKFDANINLNVDLIINQISEPDTHSVALKNAQMLSDKFNVPCLNNPNSILRLTRDKLAGFLQGIENVTVPITVAFNPKHANHIIQKI